MKLTPLKSNMTEITTKSKRILFSYQTPVAYQELTDVGDYYRTDCRWSQTTTRHINQWLGGNSAKFKTQAEFDGLLK